MHIPIRSDADFTKIKVIIVFICFNIKRNIEKNISIHKWFKMDRIISLPKIMIPDPK